jgi:sterol desaturase/sphingolipid hydroxylase (fatty acid hydroxylase superfamily)
LDAPLFHSRRLWKFHAVHHSSKEVDWLSSVRLHPVNDAVSRIFQAVPFVLLGFSPAVVAAYVPFLTLYAILLHANVSWTFGPMGYLVASPAFHRWHHTKEPEAIDKNFAGLLPMWDLLFGTFYLPKDRRPTEFGVHDDGVPENFWGQLAYPFRR